MDLLKAELERKRKAKAEEFGGQKYVKKAHITAVREAKLRMEEEEERRAKRDATANRSAPPAGTSSEGDAAAAAEKSGAAAATTTSKKGDAPAGGETAEASSDAAGKRDDDLADVEQLDVAEAIRRLRTLGQPATLFGESELDRLRRLHVVQRAIMVEDEHAGGQQANEKQTELRALEEYAKRQKQRGIAAAELAAKKLAAERDLNKASNEGKMAEIAEEENAELAAAFKNAAAAVAKRRVDADLAPIDQVGAYFKSLLEEWERELEAKPEEWIYTEEAKLQVANVRLCRNHMKPLFKRIKRRQLPGDIERALFLMVQAMKARNYRQAADVYVGVAIGNAPWPIGVTSVGIHERSAREKIGAQSQAHAMHDEETRKYLQSVKRLITFAQRSYPTVPSLSLDFNSGYNGWDKESLTREDAKLDIRKQVPALLALPTTSDGKLADGWKAQESDTRTWKSLLTHAYNGVKGMEDDEVKRDFTKMTTAKDEVLNRDKTMYDDRTGHLTRQSKGFTKK